MIHALAKIGTGEPDAQPPPSSELRVAPSLVVGILAAIALSLVGLDLFFQAVAATTGHERLFGLTYFFDLDQELNAPSYFSGLILIFSSLLLALIARLKQQDRAPHVGSWTTLCAGFLLMGADEMFSYHERLGPPLRSMLGRTELGPFHYTWVLVGIPLSLVLGLSFIRFLSHLPRAVRWNFLLAAAVYLGSAIGVEMAGGWYRELHGQNFVYSLLVALEEGGEMAGVILFIRSLLRYISDNYGEVRLKFTPGEAKIPRETPAVVIPPRRHVAVAGKRIPAAVSME